MGRLRKSTIRKVNKAIDKIYEILALPSSVAATDGIVIHYDNRDRTTTLAVDPTTGEPLDPENELAYPDSVSTIQVTAIISKVTPNVNTQYIEATAGRLDIGDVLIGCKIKDVLVDPSDTSGDTYFDRAHKVMVQNEPYRVKHNPIRSGIAGSIYTVLVVLTKDTGAIPS